MAKATTTTTKAPAKAQAQAQAPAKAQAQAQAPAKAQAQAQAPATAPTVQAAKGNTPANNAHTIVKVVPNPKRPGTAAHARYAAYQTGITVAQAVANGATREDIRWDTKRGHIVLQAPGGQ